MKLIVVRTQFGTDATNGILLIDGVFECFTLEDQYQAVKLCMKLAYLREHTILSLEKQVDFIPSILKGTRMHTMVCCIY